MLFSIVTASYNPGKKLKETVSTVLDQTCEDYELVIQDGNSTDHSVEELLESEEVQQALAAGKIKIHREKDKGVYDGMNKAIEKCQGAYLIFLNCGDGFPEKDVLQRVADEMGKNPKKNAVYYGNTFCETSDTHVKSAPGITGFTCYRNIPCHQSCFYDRHLFDEKSYDLTLKIRADYDHFLWCYYVKKAQFIYMDMDVSYYEGGGISEKKENRDRDLAEHKLITKRYMSKMELFKYKLILILTLVHLRRFLAQNKTFAKYYEKLKRLIYK